MAAAAGAITPATSPNSGWADMAYGDSILDAAIRTYQPVDPLGAIQGAQNVQMGSIRLQGAQQGLEQQKLDLDTAKQLTPLEVALKRAQAKNQLFSNALATATDSSSFDQSMRELASQGFPEAEQYIGRYSPVLQARLRSVYSGQDGSVGIPGDTAGIAQSGGTGKAAAAAGGLDYQFAQTTPEQRAASLERLTTIADGLEKVNSPESWEALKAQLAKTGMPGIDQVGTYSPIKAASIYSRIQPILSYLQNRSIADQAGIPTPRAQPDIKEAGGQLYSVDPFSGTATAITPRKPDYQPTVDERTGAPRAFDKTTGRFGPVDDGVFGFDDFAARMTGAENSTGDRTAQNPRSSATGNGQFIDATWLKTVKSTRPELAQMADKDLLQLRKDPAFAMEMTAEYAKVNAQALAQNGQPVNATTLALAHRFGANGALSILNAAPDAKLTSVLPADVIKANPNLANKTAGDYVSDLGNQVGMDPVGAPTGNTPTINPKNLSEPKLVEIDDGQGGTKQVEAQQDKFSGRWVTADEKRTPLNATNIRIVPPGGVPGGGRVAGQVIRITSAAHDLASNLENIAKLPASASGGLFQQAGMAGTPLGALARKVTTQEVQSYKAAAVGIERSLAALDAAGLAPSGAFVEMMGGLRLQEGDTELTKLQKLATMRQTGENTLDAIQASALLSREQRAEVIGLKQRMSKAIPWTPQDVIALMNSKNSNTTLNDIAKQRGLAGGFSGNQQLSSADQQALAWAKANPNDPRAAQIKKKLGM